MLTVFDLDHTLFRVNSSYEFGKYLYDRKILKTTDMVACIWQYFRHKTLGMSFHKLHSYIFWRIFYGRVVSVMSSYAQQFLDEKWDDLIDSRIVAMLEEAKQQDHRIVLLSSSPHFLVEAIGNRFDADNIQGTQYHHDGFGKFVSIGSVMDGEAKKEFILSLSKQHNIKSELITAYSDSYLDLSLLETVGKAVCVNPDRYLRRVCLRRGWKLLETKG